MNRSLLFVAVCLLAACSVRKNQNNPKTQFDHIEGIPQLSYEQMKEDHDSLVSYIKQVSPVIYFNEQVRGINFNHYAQKLRKSIHSQTTMPEYVQIVEKTLNAAQDGHSNRLGKWHLNLLKDNWIPKKIVKDIDTASIEYGYQYADYLSKSFYTKLNLDLVYTSGEYYNLLPFSYKGKEFPANMKLLSCNGIPIHKFVKNKIELSTPLRWDRINKRSYHEKFYMPAEIYENGSLKLVFLTKKHKQYQLDIVKNDTVTFLTKKNQEYGYNSEKTPLVTHYFEKEEIFYAKLPRMVEEYGDSLAKRFEPIMTKHKVKAVVLDVRGNPGGSDNTYANFFKKILKDTLKQNVVVGRNFSPYNQKFFKINRDSVLNRSSHTFKVNVATLKKPEMYYISIPDFKFVVPDTVNSAFSGKVYILQDRFIYSSASNLSNLAYHNEQLVSIGETPDLLGGLQANPTVLILPHSKIIFRIEPQIDFTNSKTPADIFQNNVEYPISYSIEQLNLRLTTKDDIFGKDFLLKYDPMFRKALELEQAREK